MNDIRVNEIEYETHSKDDKKMMYHFIDGCYALARLYLLSLYIAMSMSNMLRSKYGKYNKECVQRKTENLTTN